MKYSITCQGIPTLQQSQIVFPAVYLLDQHDTTDLSDSSDGEAAKTGSGLQVDVTLVVFSSSGLKDFKWFITMTV